MNALQPLSVRQKLCYGIGEIATTLSGTVVGFLYVFYLTNVVGISAWIAGLIYLIGSIWDAVTDPLVGYISDITRSRFGRRRGYFLFTAVPFALCFFLIWITPGNWSQGATFAYALITYLLYRTVSTLFIIPYNTYGMEIVAEYDGRTSLMSYRYFFSILFGLVSAAIPQMITTLPIDPSIPAGMPSRAGYMLMAAIFAVPVLVCPLLTFTACKEQPYNNAPRTSFIQRFLDTFRNRYFRQALGMYVGSWVAIGFIQSMLLYYLSTIQQEGNFSIIAAIIMGTAVVCLPIWVFISKKLDKRKAYMLGMAISGFFLSALFFSSEFVNSIIWVLLPLIGFGISSMHLIPGAIIPEAIEAGNVGKEATSDGIYYGVVTFSEKIGQAITVQIATILMEVFGYVSTTEGQVVTQPQAALDCIHILTPLIPILLIIGGILLARKFSIGREESQEIRRQLEAEGTSRNA